MYANASWFLETSEARRRLQSGTTNQTRRTSDFLSRVSAFCVGSKMTFELLARVAQIILIDIVLSGDNAVVIAMAAHKLPAYQRKRAILWGGGIAIVLRIVFTMVMAFLLMVPGVRLVGGLVLVWIACKLLRDEEEHVVTPENADKSTFGAIRMIFIADLVMSLDNMLAVAGAGGENFMLLLFGLMFSIGIIMFFSSIIAQLMNRYHWIVYVGAAILAYTAGEMMIGDREIASYFARTKHVSLNEKWESDFMLTRGQVSKFKGTDDRPESLTHLLLDQPRAFDFVGQMNETQRDELKSTVETAADKAAIDKIYDLSRRRDVPDWIPGFLKVRAEPWIQRKWPAEVWQGVQHRQYHWVAWIFCGAVIAFCMSSPYWWRSRGGPSENQGKHELPHK